MNQPPTILITGATDGLGSALADRLAAEGATLLLHGRAQDRLDRTADAIAAAHGGPRPRTVRADLAELAQVRDLAEQVRAGTDRLDALVSNAGIGGGRPAGPGGPARTATSCGSPSTTWPDFCSRWNCCRCCGGPRRQLRHGSSTSPRSASTRSIWPT